MIDALTLRLNNHHVRQASAITGSLKFNVASHGQNSKVFANLTLIGTMHTCIPSSSGIQRHSDKRIYSNRIPVLLTALQGSFEATIDFQVPQDCPISASYGTVVDIRHMLALEVTHQYEGQFSTQKVHENVFVQPAFSPVSPIAQVMQHKKLTLTAGPVMEPGASYFIQLSSPMTHEISSYRATLNACVQVTSDAAKFCKKTERPLRHPKIISRKAADGSQLIVLEIDTPEVLDSSVKIPGFYRTYSIALYISFSNQPSISFNIDTEVTSGPVKQTQINGTVTHITEQMELQDGKSIHSSEKRKAQLLPSPEFGTTDVQRFSSFMREPRSAPQPTLQKPMVERTTPDGPSLKRLTFDQLALHALSLKTHFGPSSHTRGVSRSNSNGSTNSTASYSGHSSNSWDSTSDSEPNSPKPILEACAERTPPNPILLRSSMAMESLSMQKEKSAISEIQACSSSPSATSHRRQRSSLSGLMLRSGTLSSLSKIGDLMKPKKDMAFACCGSPPQSLSAMTPRSRRDSAKSKAFAFPRLAIADEDSVAEGLNLSSPYSSLPSSPTSPCSSGLPASPRRRVDLGKSGTHPVSHASTYPYNRDAVRHSISSEYLSGFVFEGLSSLDTMKDDSESLYDPEDTDEICFPGLAL